MLNITRLYDQPGWCYDFITKEMARYSQCKIKSQSYSNFDYSYQDIIVIPSPNISYTETAIKIPNDCKKRGIKIIGGYAGEVNMVYDYADLIVTISPQLYLYAKKKYGPKGIPVIFLPESVDTNYFQPSPSQMTRFTPGWAGGAKKALKRVRLFEQLKYPVKIMSEHGKEFFKVNRDQEAMKEFYRDIDCFISLSETECMPRVILEAMACGLPVVSTDVGGVRLLLPDEYIIPVNPEEKCVEEANKKLETLCQDYALRDGLGRINRAWCEKCWSWEANMPIWDEVFYYLKKGDTKKILEIGDNVIEPFKKYFEMTEAYEKQISTFTPFKIEQGSRTVPHHYDHTICNLVEDLKKDEIEFWVSGLSCLDTVNRGRIFNRPENFYLGVDTQEKRKILIAYLENKGAIASLNGTYSLKGLHIHINIEEIKAIKTMCLYGKEVNVPYPVVPYLSRKFGHNWKNK